MGNKIVPKTSPILREAPYFGYSVAAGYFFSNELLYVASAPRGNQNRGQVNTPCFIETLKNHFE